MFSTDIKVGRLYEHRVLTIESEDEIEELKKRAKQVMTSVKDKVVVCADYRKIKFIKPEYAPLLVKAISSVNLYIDKSATLIGADNSVFALQMRTMINNMEFKNRKLVKTKEELYEWYGDLLTTAERNRLDDFLKENE